MAIELDMEKILSQPSDEEKQSELTRQIYDAVQAFGPNFEVNAHTDALIGFISGLVMNLMLVREYADYIANAFNQFAEAANTPFMVFNFVDFSDTHGMTATQMKEWLEQKNEKWRERKRASEGKIISLGN